MSAEWESAFRTSLADVPKFADTVHYEVSAERLRRVLRDGKLSMLDLKENPRRFFMAHKMLSEFATQVGPGFGIRFTVQFNLFAGTIIALGTPQQVGMLKDWQKAGSLGCFCLTEKFAGVNSGLVVETTCTWDEGKQMFLLDCPNEGSKKNWISQGLTADRAVVIAQLIVKGKSHGPHGFVMEMRKDGKLVPGVSSEDMGGKTIGNDLDNGQISFSKVWLPKDALLSRYSGVVNNEYKAMEGVNTMDMIGQRLYTGRTVIAQSTLVFARSLYAKTQAYTDSKPIWHPQDKLALSHVPQLSSLFKEAEEQLSRIERFGTSVEDELCAVLVADKIPSHELVEKVAVLKVKAIETSISFCFRLKQEVGSYALMAGTGFEKMDYLQCCKFAEGDSRILMQKMARDRMSAFKKKQDGTQAEAALCTEIGTAMMKHGASAWNEKWRQVYQLADLVMDRVVSSVAPSSKL